MSNKIKIGSRVKAEFGVGTVVGKGPFKGWVTVQHDKYMNGHDGSFKGSKAFKDGYCRWYNVSELNLIETEEAQQ